MTRFLIDANLPYYFELWDNADFVYVMDINDTWSDDQIWDYALRKGIP